MNIVKEYKILDNYSIWLRFGDGYETTIDLQHLLDKGIAKELLDKREFSKIDIESGGGLAWKNGFDICPNALRELAEKKVHVA